MKIALAQMEVVPGRPKKNLETMLNMIETAKHHSVDLIAFPEMCLGGYLVGDKWLDDDFCLNLMKGNEELQKSSEGIAIAYGNIFVDNQINARLKDGKFHPNKDGRSRKYNAVYVFQNGKPVARAPETIILPAGVQPKTLLPNYRFFDDERYFFSLEDIAKDFNVSLDGLAQPFLIEVNGKKIPVGFEICEDLWCEDYRRNGEAQNITKILIENGAQYLVNISASPWTFGKNQARDNRIKFLKQESGEDFVPFFYVNCVGAQNNGKNIVTFDGGSTVYNAQGEPIIFDQKAYAQELIEVNTKDLSQEGTSRAEKSYIEQKCEASIRGIKHVKDMQGQEEHPRFILGMSGGVDSAVVAALLTLAVGKDRVLGVNMPTIFNSDQTKQSAAHTAEQLGIAYLNIPIGELADVNEKVLEERDLDGQHRKLNALQKGNVAAKIRGTSILSNLAAKYHALFTNNGNKLEVALGYATLYGDVNGAICPLADLTKTEVFDLARYLNNSVFKREVIPWNVIPDQLYRFTKDQIQPSAELEENQVDPMKFGYHDALLMMMTDYKKRSAEDIMRLYVFGTLDKELEKYLHQEEGYGYQLMKRWGVDDQKTFVEDLEWFTRGIQRSVFKRVQAPPIIITSKSSYGYDLRESILPYETSLEEDRLKKQILGGKEYTPKTMMGVA